MARRDPNDGHLVDRTAYARIFALDFDWPLSGDLWLGSVPSNPFDPGRSVHPRICASNGSFVVTYSSGASLKARRISEQGSPIGSDMTVAVSDAAHPQELACFPDGSFAVVFYDDASLRLQVIDASGSPAFANPVEVSTGTYPATGELSEGTFAIAASKDGSLKVTHLGHTSNDLGIWLRSYSAGFIWEGGTEPSPVLIYDPQAETEPSWRPARLDIATHGSTVVIAWREDSLQLYRTARIRALRVNTAVTPFSRLFWTAPDLQSHEPVLSSRFEDLVPMYIGLDQPAPEYNRISVSRPDPSGQFVITWTAQTGFFEPIYGYPSVNVVLRRFNAEGGALPVGPDMDNDGVLNQYDCDPLNPYLRHDLDKDKVCDDLTGGTEAECEDACRRAYAPRSSVDACIKRCQTLDNCPCRPGSCPGADSTDLIRANLVGLTYCKPYRDCIEQLPFWTPDPLTAPPEELPDCDALHAADLQRCHDYFANPGQQDGNGNGMGDRCESRPQAHVVRFRSSRIGRAVGNTIPSGGCIGDSYEVEVTLEGGQTVLGPKPTYGSVNQRTALGACGCADPLLSSCIDETCPEGDERDRDGYLAWEGVQAVQALGKPNVTAAEGPPKLDDAEPSDPLFTINKHQEFNHDPGGNRHYYDWRWLDYVKESLSGKQARVRIAWQDPALSSYHYRDDPANSLIAYSTDWKLMEQLCDKGVEPLFVGIDKPELHVRPQPRQTFRPHPYPFALKPGLQPGEPVLVAYREGMREERVEPLRYGPSTSARLTETDSTLTAAHLSTDLFGLDLGEADVVFRFGGVKDGAGFSNALWLGIITEKDNLWLRAEDLYGPEAADGPVMEFARIVHDARNQRLLVMGNQLVPVDGQVQVLANRLWLFDLVQGRWIDAGWLPVDGSWVSYFSVDLDPVLGRAILVDGAYQGSWTDTAVFTLDLDTLRLTPRPTHPSARGPFAPRNHGSFLDPEERALYVYGGADIEGASTKAFRLDLRNWEWSYVGDGASGPG
ncbi:MAG: hypothetical protein RBU30_26725, partial [Polyangia bacterium]|nr:hypothetical protein [Polyangia bacterium]